MELEQASEVMDRMPYGLYIIGSVKDGDVNGMMADWVMQVSFDPRLVVVAFENDARTLQNVRSYGFFTVNLLAQEEESMGLAAKFAQPYYGAKIKGRSRTATEEIHHKLQGIAHTKTVRGCPVLEAAIGWLECEAEEFVSTGDHTMVIGRVIDSGLLREGEVLTSTYTGWNYSG